MKMQNFHGTPKSASGVGENTDSLQASSQPGSDSENQLKFDQSQSKSFSARKNEYGQIIEKIISGDFGSAYLACEKIHQESLQNKKETLEIFPVMECLMFWNSEVRQGLIKNAEQGNERATVLKSEWFQFEKFLEKCKYSYIKPDIVRYFRKAIFDHIIYNYLQEINQRNVNDPEILKKLAAAHLVNGYYAKARDTLLYARKFRHKDAQLLMLLAEAFYQCNESSSAFSTLKEAFLIDPFQVDFGLMTIKEIKNLYHLLERKGFSGKEINLWLPIHAVFSRLFPLKKIPSEIEVKKHLKRIHEMEIEIEIHKSRRPVLEPILIYYNIYFIDHLLASGENKNSAKVTNHMRKIKTVKESIYLKLRKFYELTY